MPSDEAGGAADGGWTQQEKGQGAPGAPAGGGDPGEAGDTKSKGRPTDDRAKTEDVPGEADKASGQGQPS
jgi:hypothetical protein